MEIAKKYGPHVSNSMIETVVSSFNELRQMADDGRLSHPYSTREAINVVKHLEEYPSDGLEVRASPYEDVGVTIYSFSLT